MKKIVSLIVLGLFISLGASAQEVTKRSVEVGDFTSMIVAGSFDIILTQGNVASLEIESDQASFDAIEAIYKTNKLFIYVESIPEGGFKAKLYVTVRDLKLMKFSGSVDLMTPKTIELNALNLDFVGSVRSTLKINCSSMDVTTSGASELKLFGKASDIAYNITGSTEIHAMDMSCRTVTIKMDGTCEADIKVESMLNATLSGTSELKYKGSPKLIQNVSGMAEIKKVE